MTRKPFATPSWRRSPVFQFMLMALRPFLREPSMLFWSFGFPLLVTVIFAASFSRGSDHELMIVAVHEASRLDQAWLQSMRQDPGIRLIELEEGKLDEQSLSLEGVRSVLELPQALREVFVAYKADLLLTPDGVYSTKTPDQFRAFEQRLLALRYQSQGGFLNTIAITVPGVRFVDWFIPGIMGLTIMSSSLGIGLRIVNDRQNGFFKRLRLGPFRRSQYVVGVSLGRALIIVIEIVLLLAIFGVLFGFRVQGGMLSFVSYALFGAFCFSLLGVAVASRVRNAETVTGLINLFFFPMMFLCGVYFKTEGFPQALQRIVEFLPLWSLNSGLRGIANEALGYAELWTEVAVMALWSGLCLLVTLFCFDWGVEE